MFVRKIRGSTAHKYLLDSEKYVYQVSRAKSHRIYWRCLDSRTKAKCPSRCSTVGDEIVHAHATHNHAPNYDPDSMHIIYDYRFQGQNDEDLIIDEMTGANESDKV